MIISVVVPNYNGAMLLNKNIPELIKILSSYQEIEELIIIDDASTDESVRIIEKIKEQTKILPVIFIRNEKNIGFSSTVNKAVSDAKGDLVVLLNTDVVPHDNFLQGVLTYFSDKDIFAVGFLDESMESGKKILRGRGLGEWKRGFLVHSRGEISSKDTLWVSGGSCIFRRSIWEKLGGFCKVYDPFYWEDIDLSYRALKSGYKIVFENRSKVIHMHEEGAIKKTYSQETVKKISYRNQILFSWLNLTDYDLLTQHILWMPYHLLKAFIKADFVFIFAFLNALVLFPQVLVMRNRYVKYMIKSDKVVINSVGKE